MGWIATYCECSIYCCHYQWRSSLKCYQFLSEVSFGLRVLPSVCVCGSVCPCVGVNYELVRTITHRSFKLGSPNLDQWCKTPWFRSLLSLGVIDYDLQGQILLENQILPHFELVHTKTHQLFKLESPNLDQKCILALLRSLLVWTWLALIFTFIFNLETYFATKFICALFVLYSWDPSLVNISETITGDRSNQFGLLTEHKFCRKLLRSISIDSCYCHRFINLGRPIFPLNHSGASGPTVFTFPTTYGIVHAWCYTHAERATQSATRVCSSLLDSLTIPLTHYIPKIVFTFSPICLACTNSNAIYSIIMRDFIFLCIGLHQQSAIS